MKEKKKGDAFIPTDVQRVIEKIRKTWTKLTDAEINHYREGNRERLLLVLQAKYNLNRTQAETVLSDVERLA